MEEQFINTGLEVVRQFQRCEIQFEPAIQALESLKAQGMDTLQRSGLGRAGRRGEANLGRNIDIQIRSITDIQRRREATLQDILSRPLPEFQLGGAVRAIHAANGGILAMHHPGEFVMRREAVQSVGESFLAQLNSLPKFQQGGSVGSSKGSGITINQTNILKSDDPHSARAFFRRNNRLLGQVIRRLIADRAL